MRFKIQNLKDGFAARLRRNNGPSMPFFACNKADMRMLASEMRNFAHP